MNKAYQYLLQAIVVLITLGWTTGCGLYKKYETPTNVPIVEEYARAIAHEPDTTLMGNLPWQEVFTDPLLQSYIDSALNNNADLQNAKLNVDIAQAYLQGAKLSYLPAVTLAPNGAGSVMSGTGAGMQWGGFLPLTVSWQADIFGQLTNAKRSAESAVVQSDAYRQAVQTQIIAAVASCYYTLVSLCNQLDILTGTAELWGQSVQMMKDMKEAGRFTEVAVVQSQATREGVLAAIPDLRLAIVQTQNTLSLLMNTHPHPWQVDRQSRLTMPANLADGVPYTFLAGRPDVRAAEQAFAQAYYATNIARANFYPQLNITATGGYGNLLGSSVVNPGKWLLNLAGSLTAPLFSRGQNTATLKAAELRQQQALNSFSYAILNASTEVSNSLENIAALQDKQSHTHAQEQHLARAVEYNNDLMHLANATYLEVISAQQALLQAQIALEEVKLNTHAAIINLYQQLGGGRGDNIHLDKSSQQ